MANQDDDFVVVVDRLRIALGGSSGRLSAADAIALAGFDRRSWYRAQLVSRAMRSLGWDRVRCRFGGELLYAYARGSRLEREDILDVAPGADGPEVKRRQP